MAASEVPSAPAADAETIAALPAFLIIDARDPNEIEGKKGGPALESSINVPFNVDGQKQSDHATSADEYVEKLRASDVRLPKDGTPLVPFSAEHQAYPIVTHCGAGGRGGKACSVLRSLGYTNVHNGGSPDNIRAARGEN
eukprot:CAMPEP_0179266850 /NCGR_PEP_ID=MMETSP0797-20121207/29626_1 /TAXON_ID=47934 /ORGANISM="Dinophysis acuminata, Strain DAEP01" /LENGTH=139 /DNA_ID=CAMNT_0020975091 /DNA_START=76 /DNA_END=495 /DNA_ORIENTATION=+